MDMFQDLFAHIRASPNKKGRRGSRRLSLKRRRQWYAIRHGISAALIGLLVLLSYGGIARLVGTVTVPVASQHILRGSTLQISDFHHSVIPSGGFSGSLLSDAEVLKRIAQVDIDEGTVLTAQLLREEPVLPDQHTAIEVRVVNMPEYLLPGDRVELNSSAGCASSGLADNADNEQKYVEPDIPIELDGLSQQTDDTSHNMACTLSEKGLVLQIPHTATPGDANTIIVALSTEEAFQVLHALEAGPVIAVRVES
ncbi:hypothetical protein [Bifidobacterium tsurumiense]|uniref:Putative flagella basal body P-ring formation protein FlgA n=1 Tax=Bifidobacterium tsurumiense TaxID=356829 RepID=A0A087ECD6_9BIFI|nr:hypothetical protein [Bifidobacterium tsurumiense]KFJ05437.1 putative flagella basal body P-ring formation protein FlgA [Bifidobacterium tsurumiense]MSS12367.1 hypothetical protein [Bifidobacterium tsurumiense]